MSTKVYAVIAALTIALALAIPANAQDARVVSQFQTIYDALGKAVVTNKVDEVLGLLADDYVSVNAKGEAKSHDDSVADMKASVQAVKSGTMQFKVLGVEAVDNGYKVKLSLHSEVVLNINGQEHKVVQDETDEDTWIKVGSAMKLQRSVTLTSTGTVDGKPI